VLDTIDGHFRNIIFNQSLNMVQKLNCWTELSSFEEEFNEF